MAYGRPALVANFEMTTPPKVLHRIAYNSAASYPFKEDYLQWLLDTTPELVPVRDFFPTVISLFSLGREIPVDVGNRQGYIDNLFVTNDARLVLVETKLYRNPEGIREVVAQTYQYGAAISAMSFIEFEGALRKGMKGGAELKPGETIAARVRGRQTGGDQIGVVDDFEDRLATNIQRGEVLYLIVADGIHASVERMTSWLNEYGGSAPHRFGLVELRSYMTGAGTAIVIPRTLVRTKEISRHVVVIESRTTEPVTATVEDRTGTASGAVAITQRTVKTSGPSLTKDRLLADLLARSPKAYELATALIAGLEAAAFDSRGTATELQYGFTFPPGDGDLFPIVSLTVSGAWSYLRTKVIDAIGDAKLSDFKRRLSQIAPFFNLEEIDDPKKQFGHPVKYEALTERVDIFVNALTESRTVAIDAMMLRADAS